MPEPTSEKSPLPLFKRPGLKVASIAAITIVLAALAAVEFWPRRAKIEIKPHTYPPAAEPVAPKPLQVHTISGAITRNTTISELLAGYLQPEQLHNLVTSIKSVYNLNRIMAGNRYKIWWREDGLFQKLQYQIDDEKYLTVSNISGEFVPEIRPIEYEVRESEIAGTIEGSLFESVVALGEADQLALDLADLFAWDIDFSTDLRQGDSFKLVVEKKFLKGEFVKYGPILAAEFVNQGKRYRAYRYVPSDGAAAYFDAEGKGLRRPFLKSPLKFARPRISSRFSRRRFHPILRIYRPHLGGDYAAPSGTPVVAVASGTVVFAGWERGGGRVIKIRHNKSYASYYMHLRGFARGIRRGARVEQGQVIGYVGSTGLATGPHLDFRITRNGRYINPLRLPAEPGPPIPEHQLADFVRARESYDSQLDKIDLPQMLAESQQ